MTLFSTRQRIANALAVLRDPGPYSDPMETAARWLAITDRWQDDSIQFPRLLAEIVATQMIDVYELCEVMDLQPEEVNELFDRAQEEWERIKQEVARHEAT